MESKLTESERKVMDVLWKEGDSAASSRKPQNLVSCGVIIEYVRCRTRVCLMIRNHFGRYVQKNMIYSIFQLRLDIAFSYKKL